MKLHREIRSLFNVTVRNDFSPIGCHRGDRVTLIDLWQAAGYKVGVEIGVHRAQYSTAILSRMPEVHLHCIDPWGIYAHSHFTAARQEDNYRIAMNALAPFAERVTVHRTFSESVYQKFDDASLDFLFIDGSHTFDDCALDLIHWVPKVRDGGMVGVHDYQPMRRGGVIEAVDGYTKCHMIHPWYVTREIIPTAFWVVGDHA